MVVETAGGAESVHRIVPAMTRAGFLLSPLVIDTRQFQMLFDERSRVQLQAHNGIRRIRIGGSAAVDEATAYDVRFFELRSRL